MAVARYGDRHPSLAARRLREPAEHRLVLGVAVEPDDVLDAIRAVADGLAWLSPVAASAATAVMRGGLLHQQATSNGR